MVKADAHCSARSRRRIREGSNPASNINVSFESNGKLMFIGVPIVKHIRVLKIRSEPPSMVSNTYILVTSKLLLFKLLISF